MKTKLIVLTLLCVGGVSSGWAGEQSQLTDSVTGIEFVFVKGGCFQMGDVFGIGEKDESPVHEVCLSDYYMASMR